MRGFKRNVTPLYDLFKTFRFGRVPRSKSSFWLWKGLLQAVQLAVFGKGFLNQSADWCLDIGSQEHVVAYTPSWKNKVSEAERIVVVWAAKTSVPTYMDGGL